MPKRASALRALEFLRNANDAESDASDQSDCDFDKNDFDYSTDDEAEVEYEVNIVELIYSGVIWTKLKDGDETSIRKRIVVHDKTGPTSYAASRVDDTSLSAFLAIFDLVKMILKCTNFYAQLNDPQCSFKKKRSLH
ncbi:unnamed protein product [Brachionus calyciflorus]|uniref:Uncharacterized protein n=1 Tax=Brachionus calyciflorus TaxID=104777 RepID=A0A814KCI9_9BILA|nr:unnamed protein product [Brachionus calyciflorus]